MIEQLNFDDTADFENAARGFIAELDPPVVRAADGPVVCGLLDTPDPRFPIVTP